MHVIDCHADPSLQEVEFCYYVLYMQLNIKPSDVMNRNSKQSETTVLTCEAILFT